MNTTTIFRWAIGIAVVIVLFFWINLAIENRNAMIPEPMATSTTPVTVSGNLVYTDPSGFSFSYPQDFILATTTDNTLYASGTSFMVPEALTKGTNLSSDSRIYVQSVATTTCSAAGFIDMALASQKAPTNVAINGTSFSTVKASDAAAGNRYETSVYAAKAGDRCVGISLIAHSGNIQNYDPGTVKEYDKEALDAALQTVLETFKAN